MKNGYVITHMLLEFYIAVYKPMGNTVASQERISISTFYKARYEEHPASSLISEETPALFRRVTVEEYLRGRFARVLREKSCLDVLRIQHGQG